MIAKKKMSILKRAILTWVFIFQLSINNHLHSMPSDEENSLKNDYTKKILKILSAPFKCCFGGCKGNSPNKSICHPGVPYQAIDNQDNCPIKQLSKDTLGTISKFLTPFDLTNLKMTCRYFYGQINDDFWKIYNISCNYQRWNESIPLMQVAFAHFWYNKREIEKAATLGFPDAKKEINLRKKQNEEDISHSRPYIPFSVRRIVHY